MRATAHAVAQAAPQPPPRQAVHAIARAAAVEAQHAQRHAVRIQQHRRRVAAKQARIAQTQRASRAGRETQSLAAHLYKPRFTVEDPSLYGKAYHFNRRYATPGPYQTKLPRPAEHAFRQWVSRQRIPFDVKAKKVDYDMRGYFKATGGAPHLPGQHFPDTFKTPYDTTFSHESRYATKQNPYVWFGDVLVDKRTGKIVFRQGH